MSVPTVRYTYTLRYRTVRATPRPRSRSVYGRRLQRIVTACRRVSVTRGRVRRSPHPDKFIRDISDSVELPIRYRMDVAYTSPSRHVTSRRVVPSRPVASGAKGPSPRTLTGTHSRDVDPKAHGMMESPEAAQRCKLLLTLGVCPLPRLPCVRKERAYRKNLA